MTVVVIITLATLQWHNLPSYTVTYPSWAYVCELCRSLQFVPFVDEGGS